MRTTKVEKEELMKSLNDLNTIRLRFSNHCHWMLFPVTAWNEDTIDIVAKNNSKKYFDHRSGKVVMKFQKNEYEFILAGRTMKKDLQSGVYGISIESAIKYHNSDYYQRFDEKLRATIVLKDDKIVYSGTIGNISEGGARIISTLDADLADDVTLNVYLNEKTLIETNAKVLRKRFIEDNLYEYGVRFTQIKSSHKKMLYGKLKELQSKCEFLNYEGRIASVSECNNSLPIALLSYAVEQSEYIGQAMLKMGVRNNYVVGSYGALKTSIFEENPYLIIIDGISASEEIILSTISKLMCDFQDLNIIAIVPIEAENIKKNFDKVYENEESEFKNKLDIIYYPLLNGELEQMLIKYL